jgi:type II secretory pathway component PulF
MKKFYYIVTDSHGKKSKGEKYASTKDSAVEELKAEGDIILSIEEEVQQRTSLFGLGRPSLSFEDKMLMAGNLATMLGAGVTLTESLEILIDQTTLKKNKLMLEDVLHRVNAGQTFAESLAEYPEIFSEIYVNMVAVGEKSGSLVEVLHYLQIQLEKEYELRRKVMGALVYPGVIVCLTITMVFGIMFFIMPKIMKIFTQFKVELPLPTQILMAVTTLATGQPFLFFLGLIAIIGLIVYLVRAKFMQPFWRVVFIHMPVFGSLMVNVNMARFSRSLYSLLKAGVSIDKALEITSKMFSDPMYRDLVISAKEKVQKGAALEDAFKGHEKYFPILAVKMLTVGERTGNLEQTTEHLANLYEQNVDNITRNLSVLLEPMLLVFMGVLVGGVAISVILPIYQLPSMIHR